MTARRAFIVTLAGCLHFAALTPYAQAAKVWRIGFLGPRPPTVDPELAGMLAAFHQGMREFGYIEGRDYTFEARYAQGRNERYPELARELVRRRVDLILVSGGTGASAARRATATIPIVFVAVSDPVGEGLIASLARPRGNVTGLTSITAELNAKRVELLREVAPAMSSVGVLWVSGQVAALSGVEAAARAYGIQVHASEMRSVGEAEAALAQVQSEHPGGLIVFDQSAILNVSQRIVAFTSRTRIPAIYQSRRLPDAGGLMSYGPSSTDQYRRAAGYVDKIIKGAKPGELPVEQPTKLELVINLKTAEAVGLTIPQSLLLRADEVIQ